MGSYKILWKRSAEKDIRRIDRQRIPEILAAVQSLSENPFSPGHRKLRGSEFSHRIRVGEYRVVYQVDTTQKAVTIYHIRHRKDIYRR